MFILYLTLVGAAAKEIKNEECSGNAKERVAQYWFIPVLFHSVE